MQEWDCSLLTQCWESWSSRDLALLVPPLLNARTKGAEQTSEENIKRLDGICMSHYSQLGCDMTLWSPGTVLS